MFVPIIFTAVLCVALPASAILAQQDAFTATVDSEQVARRASPDWEPSRVVERKVSQGNKEALRDLSSLDPTVAIPLLASYAKDKDTDPQAANIARETLRSVRGVRDYFRRRIGELHKQPQSDLATLRQFETLRLIGTKEVVAAAAPFLFDDSPPQPLLTDDYSVGASLKYQAVDTLMSLNLSDAPTNKPWVDANEEDIQKWRTWWLAHKVKYEQ